MGYQKWTKEYEEKLKTINVIKLKNKVGVA